MNPQKLLLLLGLCLQVAVAPATMTDNHGIHAVPPPGKVVIDGKLDDWDLSGQVLMCYDVENLKDTYSAKIASMYDAENLYISVHWTDQTPMGNSHDPHYQAGKAWAGDAVQFRIKTDKISHVLSWYYRVRKEPGLYIDYGKDLKTPFKGPHVQMFRTEGWKLGEGVETAFVMDENGKGYVQEIKLPWKIITNEKKYQAGESFNMGVELLYGEWRTVRPAGNSSSRTFPRGGRFILKPKGT